MPGHSRRSSDFWISIRASRPTSILFLVPCTTRFHYAEQKTERCTRLEEIPAKSLSDAGIRWIVRAFMLSALESPIIQRKCVDLVSHEAPSPKSASCARRRS